MHTFGLDSNQGTAVLLQKEKRVGEKEPIQSFGTVGHKADRLRKVCHQFLWYTKIYAFYTLPPTYLQEHTLTFTISWITKFKEAGKMGGARWFECWAGL